jgi:dihydrofolate reductase
MAKLSADITTSLDGYIAGPNDEVGNGLGDGGERLHDWAYDLATFHERHGREGGKANRDDEVLREGFESVGAFVMGRRMFDIAEEPWGDDPPFHGPVFVVTHRERDELVKQGGTTFRFVTDGLESAVEQARSAAGGKDVSVAGGADVICQCLAGGLLDEIQIHVAPVLLGGGRGLFDRLEGEHIELQATRVIESPEVTHLRYRVAR